MTDEESLGLQEHMQTLSVDILRKPEEYRLALLIGLVNLVTLGLKQEDFVALLEAIKEARPEIQTAVLGHLTEVFGR